nr:hypothetical protein [Tanacetum cinerariifolium]
DEDPSENNAIGRVCIKTKIQDIKNLKSPPSIHSDMENNNKHDLDFNDNDSHDEEEGEIPNDNTNHEDEYVRDSFWADEASNKTQNSFSKPPGFEGYKSNSPLISIGGNRNSFKQPSNCSSAPTKATCASKSRSKSINQGSMIEAFISHIEMGKVLGYDIEGSKNDLRKFIDSIGVNNVHP